jgi:hypothetical protein
MNTTYNHENVEAEQTIAGRCVQSCKRLLAGIEQTKNKIANEFQGTLAAHSQLFHLALNEAEALAFQTDYPHLVFPALAVEKIQSASAWLSRQQSLQRRQAVFAKTI